MSRGILSWFRRYKIVENEIEVKLEYQNGSYLLIFYRIFGDTKEKIENPSELFRHQYFWETEREKNVLSTASYQTLIAIKSKNPIEQKNGMLMANFDDEFLKFITSKQNVYETDESKNNKKTYIKAQKLIKTIKNKNYVDINKLDDTNSNLIEETINTLLLKHNYITSKSDNILISLDYLKRYYNTANIDNIKEFLKLKISNCETHKIKKHYDLEINRTSIKDIKIDLMNKKHDYLYSNRSVLLIHKKHLNKITKKITIRNHQPHPITITQTNPSSNRIEKISTKTTILEKEASIGFYILKNSPETFIPDSLPEKTIMLMSPLLFPTKLGTEIAPGVYIPEIKENVSTSSVPSTTLKSNIFTNPVPNQIVSGEHNNLTSSKKTTLLTQVKIAKKTAQVAKYILFTTPNNTISKDLAVHHYSLMAPNLFPKTSSKEIDHGVYQINIPEINHIKTEIKGPKKSPDPRKIQDKPVKTASSINWNAETIIKIPTPKNKKSSSKPEKITSTSQPKLSTLQDNTHQYLIEQLIGQDIKQRNIARGIIIKIGVVMVPELIKTFENTKSTNRWKIVQILGDIASMDSLAFLEELTNNPDNHIRLFAINSIKKIKKRES